MSPADEALYVTIAAPPSPAAQARPWLGALVGVMVGVLFVSQKVYADGDVQGSFVPLMAILLVIAGGLAWAHGPTMLAVGVGVASSSLLMTYVIEISRAASLWGTATQLANVAAAGFLAAGLIVTLRHEFSDRSPEPTGALPHVLSVVLGLVGGWLVFSVAVHGWRSTHFTHDPAASMVASALILVLATAGIAAGACLRWAGIVVTPVTLLVLATWNPLGVHQLPQDLGILTFAAALAILAATVSLRDPASARPSVLQAQALHLR